MVLTEHSSAAAFDFANYLCGDQAQKAVEEWGLFPAATRKKAEADQRLAEMAAGRGTPVQAVGAGDQPLLFRALAVEFVKAKKVIQWRFDAAGSESAAVAGFLSGRPRELLFLPARPDDQAMKAQAQAWADLSADEKLLAGRAVAIVTNPANKLDALTLDQVRSIFSGEVREWNLLAAGTGTIHCFGLPASDSAGAVFYKEAVPAERVGTMTVKKDTAEILKALSVDPNAIAFVDLAAIPEKGQTVKVLAIGSKDKAVAPTPETIRTAMYPLASRLYVYVHPKASDTAKDFAAFLASHTTGNFSDQTARKPLGRCQQVACPHRF